MTTQLEHFLEFYKRVESPGYAVLVTGEWGTGKTFQVQQYLSQSERWYVSLFGLASPNEIHSAILSKIDPKLELARSVATTVGAASEKMGGLFAVGSVLPDLANNILRRELKPCRVLVLDDLERTSLEMKDLLGIINEYVEHKQFRVVLIGNDKELPRQFKRIKEKVIGRTIHVEPQAADALKVFISEEKDKRTGQFLHFHQDHVFHLFSQSGAPSLRVLRQVVQDLGRLRRTLDDKYVNNSVAMRDLLSIFVSMNIELRTGQLNARDIRKRTKTRLKFAVSFNQREKENNKPPALIVSEHKYELVNFQSDIVSDTVLLDMLVHGRYVQQDIESMLDESSHFLSADDLPPWKVVIKFDTLDDASVDTGIRRMRDQFENRSIHDPGELLHIFSLMMLMADNNTFEETVEEVADECIEYIDDILEKNLLPPLAADLRMLNELYEAHDGHGYWVAAACKVQFERVKAHLTSSRETALERILPTWASEICELASNDGSRFFEELCRNHGGERPYARIPILKHINPSTFVEAWLSGQGESWRHVSWALDERYRDGDMPEQLLEERPWAVEVCKRLRARAEKLGGYGGLRIRRVIPKSLCKLVKEEGSESKSNIESDEP